MRKSNVFYNTVFLNIAEVGDLFKYLVFEGFIAAKDKDIR